MARVVGGLLALLIVLMGALQGPAPAFAQSTGTSGGTGTAAGLIQTESNARVTFGSDMQFVLRAVGVEPITNVLFLYQVDDSTVQNTGVPSYQPGASVTAAYVWRVASVLVPGSEVRYQWQLETASGKRLTTAEQSVTYNDTRFNWREARGDQLTVFYRDGDSETGQALLDEAKREQTKLSRDFGLSTDKPLRVFAYTRVQDYVSALGGRPEDEAITVGTDRIFVLAPSGTANMTTTLKVLRREVASAIFAQKTSNPYADPPRWLSEGFARYMSGEEISQDNYRALGQFAQANKLLPLRTLGGNFPNNDRDRVLAGFESLSVVKFTVDTYGPDKVKALLAAFKEGNTVDDALKKSLGVTLDQLETRWKNSLKSGQAAKAAAKPGQSASQSTRTGDGGFVDRVFGPAIGFWEGIFGAYARPILMGAGGLAVLTLVAVVGSSIVIAVRRANAEE